MKQKRLVILAGPNDSGKSTLAVDKWYVFDNTGDRAKLIAHKHNGGSEIITQDIFARIFSGGN